jgi:prophage DNA circulation protein
MGWQERLRGAAYTSPSGVRITFDYEDVSRTTPLRTAKFEFPGVSGTYVQQNGFGARDYPIRAFFTGNDHDLIATAYEAALLEPGIGKLEHPLYGVFNVVPCGDITRNDALKTAANQSIVETTFCAGLVQVYPSSETDPQSEILAALEGFDVAAAQQFAKSANLVGALNQATAKATTMSLLKSVSAALQGISDGIQKVDNGFHDLVSEVNGGMDVLIGQPLLLARQITNLISAPSRALSGIESRLEAYGRLADSIFASPAGRAAEEIASGVSLLSTRTRASNDFHIADHFALSGVAGAVTAAVADPINANGQTQPGGNYVTKPQAIKAAQTIQAQYDEVVAWRDQGFAALGQFAELGTYQIDSGEAYQALEQAIARAVGYLVSTSFSLMPERRIVIDRPRTILDLAYQLYRKVDDETLDRLINTNGLTGSEILELQRGRTIAYYV